MCTYTHVHVFAFLKHDNFHEMLCFKRIKGDKDKTLSWPQLLFKTNTVLITNIFTKHIYLNKTTCSDKTVFNQNDVYKNILTTQYLVKTRYLVKNKMLLVSVYFWFIFWIIHLYC